MNPLNTPQRDGRVLGCLFGLSEVFSAEFCVYCTIKWCLLNLILIYALMMIHRSSFTTWLPSSARAWIFIEFLKKKFFSSDGLSICFPCQCKSESLNVKLWPSLGFARGRIVQFDITSQCLGRLGEEEEDSLRESLEGEYPGLETLRLKSPRNPERCCR